MKVIAGKKKKKKASQTTCSTFFIFREEQYRFPYEHLAICFKTTLKFWYAVAVHALLNTQLKAACLLVNTSEAVSKWSRRQQWSLPNGTHEYLQAQTGGGQLEECRTQPSFVCCILQSN